MSEELDRVGRLYFPMYNDNFSLWMCNKFICEQFIRVFVNEGKPVELIGEPVKEKVIDFGKAIKSIRFDVVAKEKLSDDEKNYRIYSIDSQLKFEPESYAKRMIYYGTMAASGLNALNVGEDYDKLRRTTVIFLFTHNKINSLFMNVVKFIDICDMKINGVETKPFDDSMVLIGINLNNKFQLKLSDDNDKRVFAELMTQGDDSYAIDRILNDPELSDEMRDVVQSFNLIITGIVKKTPISYEVYDSEIQETLKGDAYNMSVVELAEKRAREEERKDIAKQLLAEGFSCESVAKGTKLSIEEVKALQDELVASNYFQKP